VGGKEASTPSYLHTSFAVSRSGGPTCRKGIRCLFVEVRMSRFSALGFTPTSRAPVFCPEVRRSLERNAPRMNVEPRLTGYQKLMGDLEGLEGNASGLYGHAGSVTGKIPDGKAGCVTGYSGHIAELPQGRLCDDRKCVHCRDRRVHTAMQ
jgi:hypothetical protein